MQKKVLLLILLFIPCFNIKFINLGLIKSNASRLFFDSCSSFYNNNFFTLNAAKKNFLHGSHLKSLELTLFGLSSNSASSDFFGYLSYLLSIQRAAESTLYADKAFFLNPNDVFANLAYFNYNFDLDELDNSFSYLKKALLLAPDDSQVHAAAARFYGKKRQTEKFLLHLNKAIALNSTDTLPLIYAANFYIDNNQLDTALVYLRKVLAINSNQVDALALMALVFSNKGNLTKYLYYLQAAERLDPQSINLVLVKIKIALQRDDHLVFYKNILLLKEHRVVTLDARELILKFFITLELKSDQYKQIQKNDFSSINKSADSLFGSNYDCNNFNKTIDALALDNSYSYKSKLDLFCYIVTNKNNKQNLQLAESKLQTIVSQPNFDKDFLLLLALSVRNQKDIRQQKQILSQYLALGEDNLAVSSMLAFFDLELNDTPEFYKHIHDPIDLNKNAFRLYLLSKSALKDKDNDLALLYSKMILDLKLDNVFLLRHVVGVYLAIDGLLEKPFTEDLRKVSDYLISSNNSDLLLNLGFLFAIKKNFIQAELFFNKALSFPESMDKAFFGLAKLYANQNNFESLLSLAEEHLNTVTVKTKALDFAFGSAFRLQKFDLAIKYALLYISENPSKGEAYLIASKSFFAKSDYDNALKYVTDGLSFMTMSNEISDFIGDIYAKKGKYATSRYYYTNSFIKGSS